MPRETAELAGETAGQTNASRWAIRMDDGVRPARRNNDGAVGIDVTQTVENDITDLGFAFHNLTRELLHPTEKALFLAVKKELRGIEARVEILYQPSFCINADQ